jgi:hypothetical protein
LVWTSKKDKNSREEQVIGRCHNFDVYLQDFILLLTVNILGPSPHVYGNKDNIKVLK